MAQQPTTVAQIGTTVNNVQSQYFLKTWVLLTLCPTK